jgi:hypothetical protein
MISGLFMAFAGSAENDQQGLDHSCAAALARFQQLAPELDRMTREAVAVLVFPHVGKGLALAGDSSGEGAMLIGGKKTGNFSITSVSIGLTSTGADARVELILFMTRRRHSESSSPLRAGISREQNAPACTSSAPRVITVKFCDLMFLALSSQKLI